MSGPGAEDRAGDEAGPPGPGLSADGSAGARPAPAARKRPRELSRQQPRERPDEAVSGSHASEVLAGAPGRWRWAEMVVLFGVAPAGLAAVSARAVIPLLVIGGVLVLAILLWDRTFDRRFLVRLEGSLPREVGRVGAIWLAAVVLLTPAVALAAPDEFLQMPRERPRLWVAIMLLYPLLSVYPQEVIFRAFFFHRYGPILGDSARLIAVNALAFGLAHAMFRNGIAVGMTTVGGALFAWTYWRTRSIPLVCLEHALYGCFVFTVGLGEYFYTGAIGRGE